MRVFGSKIFYKLSKKQPEEILLLYPWFFYAGKRRPSHACQLAIIRGKSCVRCCVLLSPLTPGRVIEGLEGKCVRYIRGNASPLAVKAPTELMVENVTGEIDLIAPLTDDGQTVVKTIIGEGEGEFRCCHLTFDSNPRTRFFLHFLTVMLRLSVFHRH